jgi:hypothetical protein
VSFGRILDLHVSHAALGAARIVYHVAVLWLVYDLWQWRAVAFAYDRPQAAALLPLALAVNAALVLGLWTRPLLVVNVVVLRALFALCLDSYTVDEVVENTSLLWAFAPAPRAFALDCLRAGGSSPREPVPSGFVVLMFTAVAILYADGLRYKLASVIWREGSAFWLGAALPHFSTGLFPRWAEVAWLMKACTWGALAYEILFPLVLFRHLRAPIAFAGLFVHAGSGAFMALPQFGMLMTGLVLLFAPWPGHGAQARARRPALAALLLAGLMLIGQLTINAAPGGPRNLLCRALGLYQRAIFIDWHFRLPGPLIRFTAVLPGGQERPIPSFDERGYPTTHDRYWKLFGFILRAPGGSAEEAALRYVRGWREQSGVPAVAARAFCRDGSLRTLALDFGAVEEHVRRPWAPCGSIAFAPPAPR